MTIHVSSRVLLLAGINSRWLPATKIGGFLPG
jgi:hypothetical protein